MKFNLATIYQVITVLLMPVAFLIGFTAVTLLPQIFGNFAALLPFFVFSAVVIYFFLSNRFLKRIVLLNGTLKPGLKDWIKVNGYVTLFMAAMLLFVSVSSLTQHDFFQSFADQMYDNVTQIDANIKRAEVESSLKTLFKIFLVVSLLIVTHFIMTIKLLRRYAGHFTNDNVQNF